MAALQSFLTLELPLSAAVKITQSSMTSLFLPRFSSAFLPALGSLPMVTQRYFPASVHPGCSYQSYRLRSSGTLLHNVLGVASGSIKAVACLLRKERDSNPRNVTARHVSDVPWTTRPSSRKVTYSPEPVTRKCSQKTL